MLLFTVINVVNCQRQVCTPEENAACLSRCENNSNTICYWEYNNYGQRFKYFDIFKMNIILKHYLNINIILLLSFRFYALIYFHLLNVTFVFNLKYYIL